MEQLNRIELRGIIGSVYVKDFVNAKVANFSVATNHCYKDCEGNAIIETTWHRVLAWESESIRNLDQLKKGTGVHVIGRLRMQSYTGPDESERTSYEILAQKVEIVESN